MHSTLGGEVPASGWRALLELLLSMDDEQALEQILDLLLTEDEKSDLAARLVIIKELLCGEKTQRQIASVHGVSIAKITRGSNGLKRLNDQTKQWLKTLF